MSRIILLVLCVLLSGTSALAQSSSEPAGGSPGPGEDTAAGGETIFITADRYETLLEDVGRSVEVRTSEEFEEKAERELTQILDDVSGVRALSLGGIGSPGLAPVEIRGFRTAGTAILLNGMKLSDPSSVSGTFDNFFGFLTLDDIERVEILKGSTGVLYGSDGQAGVINLITKQPQPGSSAAFNFGGGSYETFYGSAAGNIGSEHAGALATLSQINSSGLDTHGNYENTTFSLSSKLEIQPGTFEVEPLVRIINANIDLDTDPTLSPEGELIPNQDMTRNNAETDNYFAGITAKYTPNEDIAAVGKVYYLHNDREFFFDFGDGGSLSEFESSVFVADLQTTFEIPRLLSILTVGTALELQELHTDTGDVLTDEERTQLAGFIHNRSKFFDDLLQISEGVRVTGISDVDATVTTLEASGVLKSPWTDSRLHSSVAQGFRAPTLFESKGRIIDFGTGEVVNVGNDNLEEEESLSFDAGLEQTLFDGRLVADVTFFQIDADQSIVFDFANLRHLNSGGGKTQGIESSLLFKPVDYFTMRAAYTNLDRAEALNGLRRQRTPRNWFSISPVLRLEELTLSAELRYHDSQEIEFFGVPDRYRENGSTVLNAAANYAVNKHLSVFARGENLGDADYTEAGFRTPGISFYGGVKLAL